VVFLFIYSKHVLHFGELLLSLVFRYSDTGTETTYTSNILFIYQER